jgi:hypothetical protein
MKRLLVVSLALLVLMIGVILWVFKLTADLNEIQEELKAAYEARCGALRGLDARFPFKPPARLEPARFAAYLAVRRAVAAERQAQLDAPKKGTLVARRRRNRLLEVLRAELDAQKMGFAEYRALAARWQAVLAQDGPFDLRKAWNETAAEYNEKMGQVTASDREPAKLELPPPAKDATQAEKDLVRKHARELADTLPVDELGPLLDAIAAEEE